MNLKKRLDSEKENKKVSQNFYNTDLTLHENVNSNSKGVLHP